MTDPVLNDNPTAVQVAEFESAQTIKAQDDADPAFAKAHRLAETARLHQSSINSANNAAGHLAMAKAALANCVNEKGEPDTALASVGSSIDSAIKSLAEHSKAINTHRKAEADKVEAERVKHAASGPKSAVLATK